MATSYAPPSHPRTAAPTRPGFRPDIEGLRAVAVLLVVLGHAGVPGLAGGYVGVDVFFVISGFLITTLLHTELTTTGTISIARFYARRATRLLPAASLVLVTTVVAAWLWLPPVRFPTIAGDALASAVYGINYRLAVQGTDYLASAEAPSPVQHFWSLAVEEQFYLLWPLLLLGTVRLARSGRDRGAGRLLGRHRPVRERPPDGRAPVVVVLLLLTAVSFVASVAETARSLPWAYFGAHTRAWELGVGALLAVGAGALARIPRPVATPLGWLGLAGILVAALRYDERTAFPGAAAALPVAGAALIIAAGLVSDGRGGVGGLLGTAPAQLVGRLSYGWYLWHWPLLTIAPAALGRQPGLALNLGLVTVGLLLAAASYRWVESPVRRRSGLRSRPVHGIGLGLGLTGATVAATLLVGGLPVPTGGAGPVADTRSRVGTASEPAAALAALLAAGTTGVPANLTPALDRAKLDRPTVYADGCHLGFTEIEAAGPCVYGDPDGRTPVVLFGDSHAAHWLPALDAIGRRLGWRVVSHTKSGCPVAEVTIQSAAMKRPYTECDRWRAAVIRRVTADRPALVVLATKGGGYDGLTGTAPRDVDQAWAEGWRDSLRALNAPGTRLVLISDTPVPGRNVPECVSTHLTDVTPCARDVASALLEPHRRALVTAAARDAGVTVVDPTDWFCHAGRCPPIIGNTLVYTDHSHLSATYSTLLAPVLEAALPQLR